MNIRQLELSFILNIFLATIHQNKYYLKIILSEISNVIFRRAHVILTKRRYYFFNDPIENMPCPDDHVQWRTWECRSIPV